MSLCRRRCPRFCDLDVLVVTQVFLLAAGLMMFPQKKDRNPSVFEQRLHWEAYCMKHTTRGTFMRRLRMSKQSFDLLLSYLWDFLMVNESQARIQGGSFCTELCLYCTLRCLAGGSYLDLMPLFLVSVAWIYAIFDEFLDWVLQTFQFPLATYLNDENWKALYEIAGPFLQFQWGIRWYFWRP